MTHKDPDTRPRPNAIGFTPRYVWQGRFRNIIWRHCHTDARQGSKLVRGDDGVYFSRFLCTCPVCGLSISNPQTYTPKESNNGNPN